MNRSIAITTDSAVIGRLSKNGNAEFSPDAAREILSLQFDDADKQRMDQLSLKGQVGTLIPEEEAEVESYHRAGIMLGVIWAKAWLALKKAGEEDDGSGAWAVGLAKGEGSM